jgi:hypothetical protein
MSRYKGVLKHFRTISARKECPDVKGTVFWRDYPFNPNDNGQDKKSLTVLASKCFGFVIPDRSLQEPIFIRVKDTPDCGIGNPEYTVYGIIRISVLIIRE